MTRYKQSTALEALQVGAELFAGASNDTEMADSYRLSIRYRISSAWRERRKLTTQTSDELTCFAETGPVYNDQTALLEDDRRSCDVEPKCCLAPVLREDPQQLDALIRTIRPLTRPEDNKRREALHTLKNTPKRDFTDGLCRALGDAYFALRSPQDCAILTSNVKDLEPLAHALSKTVDRYSPPKP
jgi:hypothetical protein